MKLRALLFLTTLTFAIPAFAEGENSIYGNMTFAQGGVGFGADYERTNDDTGFGGYVRLYQKKDPEPGQAGEDGVMTFGAFLRPHFYKKNWDLYVSPGLGMVSIDRANSAQEDVSTIGPIFTVGVLYRTASNFGIGVEKTDIYGWFDEEARGLVISEVSAKLRVTF